MDTSKLTQFSSRELALNYSYNCKKPKMVILGDNGRFWVCSFAEAQTLQKMGYEIAK